MADNRQKVTSSEDMATRQCDALYTDGPVASPAAPEDMEEASDTRDAAVAPHHRKNFRGYTLSELRYRRALTSLKIDMTKDRIRLLTSPKMQNEAKTVTGYVKGLESALRYVDYALLAYNVTRKVRVFFRRLGFRKSRD